MKGKQKLIWGVLAVFLTLALGVNLSFSQEGYLVEKIGKGEVNWTEGVIKMRGEGAPPMKTESIAQARLMAVRAAKTDAMRNFLEVVNGVRVDSETIVKDMEVVSDVIRTKVEGIVGGFLTDKPHYLSDGSVWVEIIFPLNGQGGLGAIVLPEVTTPKPKVVTKELSAECEGIIEKLKRRIEELESKVQELKLGLAKVVKENLGLKEKLARKEGKETAPVVAKKESKEVLVKIEKETLPAKKVAGGYTGLIVDASSFPQAKACMSPKILAEDKEEVYGTVKMSADLAIERGVVGYAKSLEKAKGLTSRLGDNPLVVKAIDIEGAYKANPVISLSDAKIIKESNLEEAFAQCAVVIVL
ncbi:MAG: hypothetical protein COS84_08055 [Armatimonadetes bacterium CG07_land_8_20_14_0_80_40_9]|nr:MAG: hypothetical protein COS84_08055 [Armatimonadetes bacterium CG07_land_8_20_14_0_80_40_9]